MTDTTYIPNLRHLRMVQAIGRLGGVSCASRELNTSQPAVTQAVANLETEFGTEVFERCATGTFPTEQGLRFLLRVDRFFEILDEALDEVMPRGETQAQNRRPVERMIPGTQIRAMIVTSDPATVAEEAHHLGVLPASLYRSVRTLERALGRTLFDRSAHGPICNKAGELLNRRFSRACREIELARAEVAMASGLGNLEIVIGALPMAGSFELAEAIQDFAALHPSVRVKIVTAPYHALLNDLELAKVDMIFGLLRQPDWATGLHEEAMFRDSYCIAMRKGHPLTRMRQVTPADLVRYDWVVPARGTPRRQRIAAIFDKAGKTPDFRLETSSLTTIRALLIKSDVITVMTRSETQLDESLGIIECRPCDSLDALPPKGVTTLADSLPTEAHRAFLDCLRKVTAQSHHERPGWRPEIALVS